MEQQRFIGLQHYSAAVDHYHQSTMFNIPQIKVEPDIDVYGCQMPQFSLARQPMNSSHMNQAQHGCSTSYNKNDLPNIQPSFPSAVHHDGMSSLGSFCGPGRRMLNASASENLRTTEGSHIPNLHQQNGILSQPTNNSRLDNSLEQIRGPADVSRNLESMVSPGVSHCERMPLYPDSQKEIYCLSQRSDPSCLRDQRSESNSLHQKTAQLNEYESDEDNNLSEEPRKAYDLTCRSKSPVKEAEVSNDDSNYEKLDKLDDTSSDATFSSPQARSASKPQACKVCGKVLSSASSYYVHMKLHSGNKPYACSVCEAAFCRKPYLEVHMRTHTGERPFQCDMCLKRFTQKSSLNTHKRVHTGERPYSCDICHKKFAVKSYVTAHRWSHVSEKPLACQRCGLTFTSKNLFALHIRTHIDQNHECHVCGRTFMKDSYLIRHQNRVHREQGAFFSESSESRPENSSPRTSPSLSQSQCQGLATSASSSPSASPIDSPSAGDSC